MAKKHLTYFSDNFPELNSKLSYSGQIYTVIKATPKWLHLESTCPKCFTDFVHFKAVDVLRGFARRCKKCKSTSRL